MSALRVLAALTGMILVASAARATTGEAVPDTSAPPARAVFALVIGSNQSPKPELATLHYADDDAAKFHELFSRLGRSTLLTVLDSDSQELFVGLARETRPPSRDNLRRAAEVLFEAIDAAEAAGQETSFYFYYGGHGDVGPGMEGYLYLGHDKLTRSQLFRDVIGRSPADLNHVIIDACNAYYMVKRRGDYPDDESRQDFSALTHRFVESAHLAGHPNTGVMVSTSAEAKAHEWSLFGAGVFSHEVRSGLLGAADLDLDAEVSYDELEAYVAAANSLVENPSARVRLFSQAPAQDRRAPIISLSGVNGADAQLSTLTMPTTEAGRFHIEDGRGMRYVDLHKAADGPLAIWLLPGQRYYLHGADFEVEVPSIGGEPQTIELSPLTRRAASEPSVMARGAIDDALRKGIYALPFSSSFMQGYLTQAERRSQEQQPAVARGADSSWSSALPYLGWGVLGAGVLVGAGGGTALLLALDSTEQFERAATLEHKLDAQRDIEQRGQLATGLLAIGGGLAAAGGGALIADLLLTDAE